jgi:prepilin-type N-terminal cleavage/methylation domain-containing protein
MIPRSPAKAPGAISGDSDGFTLMEVLIANTILLIIAIPLFGLLNSIQKAASEQAEIQQIQDNVRIALQAVTRSVRQAGNDPHGAGFEAVSPVSATEIRVQSDLTGSRAPGSPNRGDPDGDIMDSGEDILIRYTESRERIEMVRGGGTVQIVADHISGFALQYLDAEGKPSPDGTNIRSIRIKISGTAGRSASPARKPLSLERTGSVRILP